MQSRESAQVAALETSLAAERSKRGMGSVREELGAARPNLPKPYPQESQLIRVCFLGHMLGFKQGQSCALS